MSGGVKVQASRAMEVARQIAEALEPACDVIEIAGSLRRAKPLVGDIEIICISRFNGLFNGAGESLLETLLRIGPPACLGLPPVKNGPKFKQFLLLPSTGLRIKLDLFIVRRDSWGLQLALRTGPVEFSKQLVTPELTTTGDGRPGLLRRGLCVAEGSVWRGRLVDTDGTLLHRGVPIPVETEAEFFTLIAGGYVPPEERE